MIRFMWCRFVKDRDLTCPHHSLSTSLSFGTKRCSISNCPFPIKALRAAISLRSPGWYSTGCMHAVGRMPLLPDPLSWEGRVDVAVLSISKPVSIYVYLFTYRERVTCVYTHYFSMYDSSPVLRTEDCSHWHLQFQSNDQRFIPDLPFCMFAMLFSNSEKPGSYYHLWVFVFDSFAWGNQALIAARPHPMWCPPHHPQALTPPAGSLPWPGKSSSPH